MEQKVVAHEISYNAARQKSEICIRLEDVKPSGVCFVPETDATDQSGTSGWVHYARPFVDDANYELTLEIGGEATSVDLSEMRADFHGLSKARVSSLFQVVANKMNLPTNAPLGLMMLSGGRSSQSASPGHTPLSEDKVKVCIDQDTDITLDGVSYDIDWTSPFGERILSGHDAGRSSGSDDDAMSEDSDEEDRAPISRAGPSSKGRAALSVPSIQTADLPATKKRKRGNSDAALREWIVRCGHWRLRIQPNPQDAIRGALEVVFVAVKIDAYSSEKARNSRRSFLL